MKYDAYKTRRAVPVVFPNWLFYYKQRIHLSHIINVFECQIVCVCAGPKLRVLILLKAFKCKQFFLLRNLKTFSLLINKQDS